MPRTPPRRADEHLRWLKLVIAENSPTHALPRTSRAVGPLPPLGALTGTDFRALEAIDRCWALLGYVEAETVLVAVTALAKVMQESTRPFARVLIARYGDWGDMDRYWPQVLERLKPSAASSPSIVELAAQRVRLVAASPAPELAAGGVP